MKSIIIIVIIIIMKIMKIRLPNTHTHTHTHTHSGKFAPLGPSVVGCTQVKEADGTVLGGCDQICVCVSRKGVGV